MQAHAGDTGSGDDGCANAGDERARPAPWLPLSALPDAALLVDAGGMILAANGLAAALFGRDPGGEVVASVLDPAPEPGPGGEPARSRAQGRRGDGEPFTAEVAVAVAGAPAAGRVMIIREPDDARRAEWAGEVLGMAFERAPVGMAVLDAGERYLRANPALCRLLGRACEDVLGRRERSFTQSDDRDADAAAMQRSVDGELDTWQADKRFVRPDGSIVNVIASMTYVRDEAGNPVAWLGQYQDITDRKSLETRLRRLADEDPLTNVPNRRSFEVSVKLALELSARHHVANSLLMIDLDGFKSINDTYGHATGDAALAAVADSLRGRLRSTDLLARVGGDEFAVLLRSTGRHGAQRVADDLVRRVVQTRLAPGLAQITLSASVGVTEFGTQPLPTLAEVFAEADAAMYAAKRRPRRPQG